MNPAEEYILKQPEPYRSILMHLQVLIEQTIPEIELKYKWQLPFYYYKGKPFCYFNASHKKEFVDVGFVKGTLIKKHQEYQITEKRKKMMSLRYQSLEMIADLVLIDVLNDAVRLY
ncbi:DUF1801 domain-containing protein [Lacinutrix sp. Hel_I_90]|uniref:DUF1801 domain-containing protein n=1 Tax=Lacinutrix sp. Hel_I_90 TaxID=1249999 RepID=UPI0005C940FA|nr:DUF1801 domain-containing protein [Lacinutrix sp. Hel_I_90]